MGKNNLKFTHDKFVIKAEKTCLDHPGESRARNEAMDEIVEKEV